MRTQDSTLQDLRALYFPVNRHSPRLLNVRTVFTETGRTPVVEASPEIPQYPNVPVQKSFAHVRQRNGNMQTFVIFFRHSASMGKNRSIANTDRELYWTGDVVVMKAGNQEEYVHLQRVDRSNAIFALKSFARQMNFTTVAPRAPRTRANTRRTLQSISTDRYMSYSFTLPH
ncbi:hypothetical protein JOM56_013272 [Amanita muscaria]